MIKETASPSKIPVCQHKTKRIPRQPDGDAFYRIYSGGMRAAEASDDAWQIEPLLDDGSACTKGFMSKEGLQAFFKQYGFRFIAFHRIVWTNGNYHSSWCPFIPGQTNHLHSPVNHAGNPGGCLVGVMQR
ncbi:MAG: hypothetical protein KDJ43_03710 [Rhizobiaceae bacterium]|nr:hypothetical protein [Rhizobiaceae bacterium]